MYGQNQFLLREAQFCADKTNSVETKHILEDVRYGT